jgi:SAM-dependent MidA family methyltransferase
MSTQQPPSVSAHPFSEAGASGGDAITALIRLAIARQGGWLPFDRFMALALYAPGLGYYARGDHQFGALPSARGASGGSSVSGAVGSDFITAPELSPLFGQALARQVAQALAGSATDALWEFGAGTGVLARELLDALDALAVPVRSYTIVEVSGSLRDKQRAVLARHADRVHWVDELPAAMHGVVVGNEVLDAMPVQLLHFDGVRWRERGVVSVDPANATDGANATPWAWADRDTDLRPPMDATEADLTPGTVAALPGAVGPHGTAAAITTEIHPQAEAFIATLADRLQRGAAFFIDYGFPAREYYHPQRTGGTLMCHRAHRADTDPLADVGSKDITAHINFTGIALAAQHAGLDVLGYTSQAHFLMNCGVLDLLQSATTPTANGKPSAHHIRLTANTQKLLTEHEMGELFKVIGFAKNCDAAFTTAPIGFSHGDRTHTL